MLSVKDVFAAPTHSQDELAYLHENWYELFGVRVGDGGDAVEAIVPEHSSKAREKRQLAFAPSRATSRKDEPVGTE